MGQVEKASFCCSQRMLLGFLAFIGNIFVYTTRVNLSVAIVCMVRDEGAIVNMTLGNGSDVSNNTDTGSVCGDDTQSGSSTSPNMEGEFDWDKSTKSNLLAMYFYGYIFTQIPGGWLASRYGGKRVWGFCMFIQAVSTLVTPISARTHVYIAYAVRFILGFVAGVTFPAVHAMLGKWTPPFERSKMSSLTFGGPLVGNILTFSISGVLCEYGFDNGWGSIFYLAGMFNLLWVISWFLLTADSPAQHKRITEKERVYIEASIGKGGTKKFRRVPWAKVLSSGPLWAIATSHFCNNYVNYTLVTSLPTFMKESLNFDIKQNGVLSALPYVCNLISSLVVSYVADTVREKGLMSTRMVRKLAQFTSFMGMAVFLAAVGQMGCEQRHIAVAMLCLCTTFMGCNRAGYVSNHLDLAPSYAGVLFGITNAVATIPGMIAPIIAGVLTPNRTPEEWRTVFYVCAAVAATGGVIYVLLADGELQPWAIPPESKQELEALAQQQIVVEKPSKEDANDGLDVTENGNGNDGVGERDRSNLVKSDK